MTTGASGLIGAVGAPLLRLLAERSGLRSGLSTALGRLRPDFIPEHDRGQVLIDVAVALGLGAVSVAGAANLLSASQAVLGQVASTPTTWRALTELDPTALAAVAKARAGHRRAIWARLTARDTPRHRTKPHLPSSTPRSADYIAGELRNPGWATPT